LAIKIERELEAVEGEMGNLGDDIAEGLCQRLADEWNLIDAEHPQYPEWLCWVVEGVLRK
jgi:hypothetical protein